MSQAMQSDLMAGIRHGTQGAWIDGRVPRLNKEGRLNSTQALEQLRHHLSNGHVRSDRLVVRPLAKLDIRCLAKIVECKADRPPPAVRTPARHRGLTRRTEHHIPRQSLRYPSTSYNFSDKISSCRQN